MDFKVMSIASAYQNHQMKKDKVGKDNKPVAPTLTKEEMVAMLKRAKEIQADAKNKGHN